MYWAVLMGFPDLAVCGLSAENEYLRRGFSGRVCNERLYLSGIHRTGYYEEADV